MPREYTTSAVFGMAYFAGSEVNIQHNKSGTMKLKSLGIEGHKFILERTLYVFIICTACDTAHVKAVVKLLPNTLLHVSGNIIQCRNGLLA